jgi:uncharacterized protein YlxP (DUF503 family)
MAMGERDDTPALHLGGALVELHLPGVSSLKEKRSLVKPLIAALVNELGGSVAEVGWQDRWQRAALGIGLAASSASQLDRALERLIALCERDPRVRVTKLVDTIDVVRSDDA